MQYIYLIECQGYYKIGVATDVGNRVSQMATGNPFEMSVVSVYEFGNADVVEKSIHQRFSEKRLRGEWFLLSAEEVVEFTHICRVLGGKECDVSGDNFTDFEEEEKELDGEIFWRLERRNDRNPPGFAVMQRGTKKYLGYVSAHSLKNPNSPTKEEVERVIFSKKD